MKHHMLILLTLLAFCVFPASTADADVIPVPGGGYTEISQVLQLLAEAGDTLEVSNHTLGDPSVPYQAFTMESGVTILAKEG